MSTNAQERRRPLEFAVAARIFESGGGYPLLLLLTFVMDFRRVLAIAWAKGSQNGGLAGAADFVNFLVLAEWWCLYEIARRVDWSKIHAGRPERLAGLAFAAYALFFVVLQSHVLTAALGVAIALRLALASPEFRPVAIVVALISLQDAFGKEVFGYSINALVADLDARGAHLMLFLAGFPIERSGNALHLIGTNHVIRVVPTCATTVALFEALTAFGVFAIWLRAELRWRLALLAGALVVAVFQINWLRLSVVTLSKENYDYWHDGSGRAIIGMTYVVLAFFLAHLAAPKRDAPA